MVASSFSGVFSLCQNADKGTESHVAKRGEWVGKLVRLYVTMNKASCTL